MQKFAPHGIVSQQFSHREMANANPGDIVGLVGSMEVDSVNFLGAPIGRIVTLSNDLVSWVVVELFSSMIVEQTAGPGGVNAGDALKTNQATGAAALITTLGTQQATLATAVTATATALSALNAAQATLAANPNNASDISAVQTATTTYNTAVATQASAQAAVDATLASIQGLANYENTVVTAAPGTLATDVPLVWGRALNTVAAGGTVYVMPV